MVKKKAKIKKPTIERISIQATQWIGTTQSIILHTCFFLGIFTLYLFGQSLDSILLILTTVVSLEAIYLAIFIQMTVNRNTASLQEVEEDIDEIQEDVKGLEEDVEDISEDIDEIQEEDELDEKEGQKTKRSLENIETGLQKLLKDIENLKNTK